MKARRLALHPKRAPSIPEQSRMRYFSILLRVSVLVLLFWGLHFPIGGALKLGPVLDPLDGVWGTARSAKHHVSGPLKLDGMLDTAEIEFDERGVPHIFASSDQDAIIALGYLVAQGRARCCAG